MQIDPHVGGESQLLDVGPVFSSSNQVLVAVYMRRRSAKPSGVLCITQSTTTCCINWVRCLQTHVADSCVPQSFSVSPTLTAPQRRQFWRWLCSGGFRNVFCTSVTDRESHRGKRVPWLVGEVASPTVVQKHCGRTTPQSSPSLTNETPSSPRWTARLTVCVKHGTWGSKPVSHTSFTMFAALSVVMAISAGFPKSHSLVAVCATYNGRVWRAAYRSIRRTSVILIFTNDRNDHTLKIDSRQRSASSRHFLVLRPIFHTPFQCPTLLFQVRNTAVRHTTAFYFHLNFGPYRPLLAVAHFIRKATW